MTDTTPRLALPELAAAQSQKHVTVNEALVKLDALTDLYLTGMTLTAPPASPLDGDAYLVASGGTGAWSGYDGKIAYCIDGAWRFYTPFNGLRAYNAADSKAYFYTGSAWQEVSVNKIGGYSVTLSGAIAMSGAYSFAGTLTGNTTVTYPTSGTLATTNTAQTISGAKTFTATPTFNNATYSALFTGGNVGIGTANPGTKLEVNLAGANQRGAITLLSGGATNYVSLGIGRTANDFEIGIASATNNFLVGSVRGDSTIIHTGKLHFGSAVDAVAQVTFDAAGNVGIGTASPTTFKLNVAGSIGPNETAADNLGSASLCWNNGWIQNAWTIVSDINLKTEVRHWQASTDMAAMTADTATASWTAAELALGKSLARLVALYKMKAAVAEKGSAKARIHTGWIAQEVVAAFVAQGLDALVYGCVGFDLVTKTVSTTKTSTVPRQKIESKTRTVETVTVTDGVAVLTTTTETYDDPVFETLVVKDSTGNVVLNADGTARTYKNPVMEDVTETITTETQEQDYENDGVTQKRIYSVRMDELNCFVIATQEARVAALEAK